MKTLLQVLSLIAWLFYTPGFAQENESQMYLVHEDVIVTSERENYVKAAEQLKQAMVDHGTADQTYYTYSTDDNRFLWISPIESHADIDNHPFQSLATDVGNEGLAELLLDFEGTYTTHRNYVIHAHPELSYNIDKFNPENNNYYHWLIKRVHTDKYQEFMEHLKEWKDLYDSTNPAPEYGYSVYMGGIGTEQPLSFIMFWGTNKVDFYTEYEEVAQRQGEERKSLGQKMQPLLAKDEKVEGRFHPELSYIPQPSEETVQSGNE